MESGPRKCCRGGSCMSEFSLGEGHAPQVFPNFRRSCFSIWMTEGLHANGKRSLQLTKASFFVCSNRWACWEPSCLHSGFLFLTQKLGKNSRILFSSVSLTKILEIYENLLQSILRQKKNYENSNYISPFQNIIFKKKSSKRNQNPSRYHNFCN